MSEGRLHQDKFQSLTNQLCDAVCMYFEGADHATVMNLVHACNMLTRDIKKHFDSQGVTSKKDVKLLSNQLIFSGKGPLKDYFLERGNFVKHADKGNAAHTTSLSEQGVIFYLLVTLLDYQSLKEALLKADAIDFTKAGAYAYGLPGLKPKEPVHPIYSLSLLNYFYEPRIDFLSRAFFEWYKATSLREDPIVDHIDKVRTDSIFENLSLRTRATLGLKKSFQSMRNRLCGDDSEAFVNETILRHTTKRRIAANIRGMQYGIGSTRHRNYFMKAVSINGEVADNSVPLDMMVSIADLGVDLDL